MKLALALAAAASAAAFALPAAATQERSARCVVRSGAQVYRGPCKFLPEDGKGSFSLGPENRSRRFFGGVTSLSVTILSPGVADVRGGTADGINSRWGEARRSPRDRACWVGAGFSVCAY